MSDNLPGLSAACASATLSFEKQGTVMPALVAGIHACPVAPKKTWMAGTRPAMTARVRKRQPALSARHSTMIRAIALSVLMRESDGLHKIRGTITPEFAA